MTSVGDLAAGLSGAFLAGSWNEADLLRRGRAALDLRPGVSASERETIIAAVAARRASASASGMPSGGTFRQERDRLYNALSEHPHDASLWAELGALLETFRVARESAQNPPPGTDQSRLRKTALDIGSWLRPVVRNTLAAYHRPPRDRPRELAAWLEAQPDVADHAALVKVIGRPPAPIAMGKARWPVRPLADVGALASWLRLDAAELANFADVESRHRTGAAKARHYRVTSRVGRSGSVRVLEAPKERLKSFQRLILRDILNAIPVHDAAHGVAGRSALTAAQRHVGRPLVVLADLESFFASIGAGRVYGTFRSAGYAEPVAHVLTGLCTTALASAEWVRVPAGRDAERHWRLGRRLGVPHLPQGAPTSPALANLVAWSLDLRLAGLARSWQLDYDRYADDLIFSGPAFRGTRGRDALMRTVADIVTEEGFALNAAKTRSRTPAQRQEVLGVVVNQHPAVSRKVVDELRAVLHNCARLGPATQNRGGHPDFRAHLQGRISWVRQVQPARGGRLQTAFEAIDWNA